MANEQRLVDANVFIRDLTAMKSVYDAIALDGMIKALKEAPTMDAVPVEQYKVLLERYHELRENFIDYYCSGIPNVSPYCLNRCEDCVNTFGWCKYNSDKCRGFNPAEVIVDGERRTDV